MSDCMGLHVADHKQNHVRVGVIFTVTTVVLAELATRQLRRSRCSPNMITRMFKV